MPRTTVISQCFQGLSVFFKEYYTFMALAVGRYEGLFIRRSHIS
jgi:hypothetical protein